MQIKYLQSKISISFRTRLTRYIHDLYLNDELSYYKLTNLDGGLASGGGPDQFITSDLTLFCDSAAALYSSLGKPTLDLIVFNYQLARSLGLLAFTGIMTNYIATAWLLRKLAPNFARLAEMVGRGEGQVRAGHTRLIGNAEEIAFYGGAEMEKKVLERGFKELKTLLEGIYSLKIRYNMLEDFVLKYSWCMAFSSHRYHRQKTNTFSPYISCFWLSYLFRSHLSPRLGWSRWPPRTSHCPHP